MANDFRVVNTGLISTVSIDPEYRFPVLLHWTFTSVGETTFRTLMEKLDSGLLGTHPSRPGSAPGAHRGHGAARGRRNRARRHRSAHPSRRLGPRLVPRPPAAAPGRHDPPRLPLAHAADQLRAVVPDRREDLSLAAAFEIGRLLALSQPSMVAALLRWRQDHYLRARSGAVWGGVIDGLDLHGGASSSPAAVSASSWAGAWPGWSRRPPRTSSGDPLPLAMGGTLMGLGGSAPELSLVKGLGIENAPTKIKRRGSSSTCSQHHPGRTAARRVVCRSGNRVSCATLTPVAPSSWTSTKATGLLALDALGVPAQLNPHAGRWRRLRARPSNPLWVERSADLGARPRPRRGHRPK